MIPLEPDKFYHIYNRANGDEKIFRNIGNYEFFLRKYQQHIGPIAETFCYCLMPNHFHLLVKMKSLIELKGPELRNLDQAGLYCSKKFSNFFSSFAQAFNKQHNRTGSLFQKQFKRKCVDSEKYLYQLIHYIHNNPVAANLVEDHGEWKFSSYKTIISDGHTFLQRKAIIDLYDDLENFKSVHARTMTYDKVL
ncbi:transposase [Salinimicrobium sp. CAU 1759]